MIGADEDQPEPEVHQDVGGHRAQVARGAIRRGPLLLLDLVLPIDDRAVGRRFRLVGLGVHDDSDGLRLLDGGREEAGQDGGTQCDGEEGASLVAAAPGAAGGHSKRVKRRKLSGSFCARLARVVRPLQWHGNAKMWRTSCEKLWMAFGYASCAGARHTAQALSDFGGPRGFGVWGLGFGVWGGICLGVCGRALRRTGRSR
eukprot:COSAG05_NODE_149_length_16213_cov_66.750279_11_plen_201_part_00